MASLRRPSHAPPRTQVQHHASQSTLRPPLPGDAVAKRDARKSKVGDKIRKRMSMRYAGTDDFLTSTPAPAMPSTSDFLSEDPYGGVDDGSSRFGQFASSDFQQSGLGGMEGERIVRRGAADMTRDEEWDMEELGAENFDLQGFMKRTLTGADEDEVKRFKAALQRSKQANGKELQKNVFKHYAEFVSMSKEIATLENDMLELKELLGQWKDLPQLMGMEDTLAPTLDKNGNLERRRTQRNSIADLQQMYKTQLTTLWSTVEGSQKYLPVIPGRHLVFETHNFVELNAATYKAKQSVSMFLLNDLLLIAGRRRMKSATAAMNEREKERDRGRMVAERCWVLADLVVVDVKDSGDLTNALKIKRGKEVCVYRTSRPEDKKALLGAFRQVSQELGEKKRKESEKEQQRRKSMWQGEVSSPNPGLLSPGRPVSTIGMTVSDSKDLRWIDDFGDELTMAIAMRDWDEAVSLAEKSIELEKIAAPHAAAKELLDSRLTHLRPTLLTQILHDLSSSDLRKNATVRLVSLLVRLNSAEAARDTLLRARREVMQDRIREIKCEGDISIYISELAVVCFTILRHTSDWYMSAFKETRMASGFVVWAKTQIETFAELFRRQVYAPTIPESIVHECLKVVASHNRRLLRDVGLDFTYLLSSLLAADPSSKVEHHHSMFDLSAPTPAPVYHIDPSPYPSYAPTPAIDDDFDSPLEVAARTAPLSINPKSPRRPRPSAENSSTSLRSPESPAPPPRSTRRPAVVNLGSPDIGSDGDSLR